MEENKKRNIIFAIIAIGIIFLLYFVLKIFTNKGNIDSENYLKNYQVNEYVPTYISDENMANIYLNDFIHYVYFDLEYSYDLLDEEYRNKKFGSFELYKNYINNNFNYPTYTVSKYYKEVVDGYTVYGVYDQNGNFYAFKTDGVLQYTVFFDDYTVKIW